MPPYSSYPNEYDKIMSEPALGFERKEYKNLLIDLQANILKHHRKEYANHILITFQEGCHQEAKEWLTWAAEKVTPAIEQLKNRTKSNKDSLICCIYLSSEGYDFLGLDYLKPRNCPSFYKGLRENVIRGFDTSEFIYSKRHAMVLLASNSLDDLKIETKKLRTEPGSGTEWILNDIAKVHEQLGFTRYADMNNKRGVIDWFGFRDGISNPVFFPDAYGKNSKNITFKAKDIAPLRLVLTKDPGGKMSDSSGSFLAYLKFRQNGQAFDTLVNHIAEQLDKSNPNRFLDLAKATIVGRHTDGTPLTLSNRKQKTTSEKDFDYKELKRSGSVFQSDELGVRCPFHGHIRKVNPRTPLSDYQDRRIVRRGVLYASKMNDDLKELSDNFQEADTFEDKGMLFMSFQNSLETQFEYIITNWMHNNFWEGLASGRDILTSKKDNVDRKILKKWNGDALGNDDFIKVKLNEALVSLLEGHYFFAPSISFLSSIGGRRSNIIAGGKTEKVPQNVTSNTNQTSSTFDKTFSGRLGQMIKMACENMVKREDKTNSVKSYRPDISTKGEIGQRIKTTSETMSKRKNKPGQV